MTTNTGFAPDLSYLNLPDDKLEKVSELLGAALQAHQALNTFAWYRKSTQAVKNEVSNLKKQITESTGAQFDRLASQIQDRTGVDIRKFIPSGGDGDGIVADLTKQLVAGDYKGAAKSLGAAAKDKALEKLKEVNPEVAGYVDKALNGDLVGTARSAALDKLKEVNPDAAKFVQQAMDGDVKGAAKSAVLDQISKSDPELAGLAKQAIDGDITGAAKTAVLDRVRAVNPDAAQYMEQASRGDIGSVINDAKQAAMERVTDAVPEQVVSRVKSLRNLAQDPDAIKQAVVDSVKSRLSTETSPFSDEVTNLRKSIGKDGFSMFEGGQQAYKTLASTSNSDFRNFLQSSRASTDPVVQVSKDGSTLFRTQKFNDDIGEEDFEAGPRRTLLDTFETRPVLSKARSAISNTLDRLKSSFVTGSDSTLARALNPDIPPPASVSSEETSGSGIGLGGVVNDLAGVAGLADAIKSGSKPAIGLASSGLASSLGQTVGAAIGSEALESAGGLAGQALGLAGLGMAIKSGNREAIGQQSATLGLGTVSNALKSSATDAVQQAASELTTGATDTLSTLGEAGTSAAKTLGTSVAKKIGESLGEKLGEDSAETAGLDGTGIGEVIDAGLAVSQLVTSFIDLFKSKPKPPAVFEGDQVGL